VEKKGGPEGEIGSKKHIARSSDEGAEGGTGGARERRAEEDL